MRTTVWLLALAAGSALAVPAAAQTTEHTAYVSVLDSKGQPVAGLGVDDFVVTEDGRAREVLRAGRTSDPIDLAVLVDNSLASEPHIHDLRRALQKFFVAMTEQRATIAMVGMADRPTVLLDYTSAAAEIRKATDRLFAVPSSGMVFQDAVTETLNGLARRENPRRALLVITGEGTDFSNRPYRRTLEQLDGSGAALHVVLLADRTNTSLRDDRARERAIVIDEGTRSSGGRRQDVLTSMAYNDALSAVAEELGNQYKVVFARPGALLPPKSFKVEVKDPKLTARGTLVRGGAAGAAK